MNRTEAEAFLIYEVSLIDDRRLEEWLELFTEDGVYWVPIYEDKGPNEATSIIYDLPIRRQERVYRLLHTTAPVEDPPHRLLHVVGNVQVHPAGTDEAKIYSNQVVYVARPPSLGLDELFVLPARCEHHVRRVDGRWRIQMKKVLLLNRDFALPSLPFIL